MNRGWIPRSLLPALLGTLLCAATACPGRPQVGRTPEHPATQLGFKQAAAAEQLGLWWSAMGGPRNVYAAFLAPDGQSLVLGLRHSVDVKTDAASAAQPADAVLIESAPALRVTPLQLGGRIAAADLSAPRRLTVARAAEAGSAYFDINLADMTEAGAAPPVPASAALSPGLAANLPANHVSAAGTGDSQGTWIYTPPAGEMAGTGRVEQAHTPGRLQYFAEAGAAPAAEVETGDVPFTQCCGDFGRGTALLAAPGAGVLLVNFTPADPERRWVLRDGGETGLYLQRQGTLVAVSADGIRWIAAADLLTLAERLSVGQQLSAAQTKRLKPAVEALGWAWDKTQLSPLGSSPGVLSLFDTADLDSATAELEWDVKAQQARRLLIARAPRDSDEALRTADASAQLDTTRQLLALLGWPDAEPPPVVEVTSVDMAEEAAAPPDTAAEPAPAAPPAQPEPEAGATPDAPELAMRWTLTPDGAAGEFSLWLTPAAALLELKTTPVPVPAEGASQAS